MSRTFLIFSLTQILSLIGSRMSGVAIGIRISEQTGEASPILLAAFFAELPLIIAGTFTGIIADKFDKRYVIVLGDIGQAVGTVLLLVSFSSGAFQLWHLYLVMFLQGIFAAIQSPASTSAITLLVPPQQRDRANGIYEVGFNLAGIVAPVFAGLVYTIASLEAVFILDLLSFVFAVFVVINLNIPKAAITETAIAVGTSFWRNLLAGWLFLWQRRALLWMVIYLAFVFFLINGPLGMAIPYMLALTGDENLVGILLAAMSAGAFAGGLAISILGGISHRIRVILAAYLLHGLFLVAYGIVREPLLLGICIFLAMFPLSFNGAIFNTFLQNKTPPDMQGRIFAVTGQIFTISTPFSFLLTAFLVDRILEPAVGTESWQIVAPIVGNSAGSGMGLVFVIIGIIIVGTTILIWLNRNVRSLEVNLPYYEVHDD